MNNKRKLPVGEKVEVRQLEEGLRGSWHPGVVVDVADLSRSVTYDELLDSDCSKKLTEHIHVTSAIEGNLQRRQVRKNYRGRIRPLPPQSQPSSKLNLNFGTCVDVFFEDAWWEGVVLDPDGDLMTCLIYFPDEAVEGIYKVSDLRLSLEWDEFLDCWKERGIWELVNLVKEHRGDAYLVKAVWNRLWSKDGFEKIISRWTCYTCNSWRRHVINVFMEIAVESSLQDHVIPKKWKYKKPKTYVPYIDCQNEAENSCREEQLNTDLSCIKNELTAEGHKTHNYKTNNGCSEEMIDKTTSSFLPGCSKKIVDNTNSGGAVDDANSVLMPEGNRIQSIGAKPKSLDDEWEEDNQSAAKGQSRLETPETDIPHFEKEKGAQHESDSRVPAEDSCREQQLTTEFSCIQNELTVEGHKLNNYEVINGCPKGMVDNTIFSSIPSEGIKSQRIGSKPLDKSKEDKRSAPKGQPRVETLYTHLPRTRKGKRGRHECHLPAENSFREKQSTTALSVHNEPTAEGNKAHHIYEVIINDYSKGMVEEKEFAFMPLEGNISQSIGGKPVALTECEEDNDSTAKGQSRIRTLKTRVPHMEKGKAEQGECRSQNSLSSPQQRKKPVPALHGSNHRKNSSVDNTKPVKYKLKERDSLRIHKDSRSVSLLEDEDLIMKIRQFAPAYPFRLQRLSRKEDSTDVTNQQDSAVIDKSAAKIINHHVVENEDLEPMPTEDNVIDAERDSGQPVLNSVDKITLHAKSSKSRMQSLRSPYFSYDHDTVCMVCHHGGELILCNHCPSTYHLTCINLKNLPDGEWFCPICRCGLCGVRDSSSENRLFTRVCHQCSRQYHVDCLVEAGVLFPRNCPSETFCSQNCFELCERLHQMLGSHNLTSAGLTWTLIRSGENDCNVNEMRADTTCCLSHASELLKECFGPAIHPYFKTDLVHDIIFNSVSTLKRLDFHGFYIMILQSYEEIISAATVRIHGRKLAEMPLACTRLKYRRQGMFGLLVLELQKMLTQLGIERLVVPVTPTMEKIWETSFGFTQPSPSERLDLLNYPLLNFLQTKMFQKVLKSTDTNEGQQT